MRIIINFVQAFKIMFKTKKYFSVKHYSLIIIVFLLFSLGSRPETARKIPHKKITRIVIDAGHGGHDPGAVGKKSKEKDITLDVALLTGKMIQTFCPGIEVFYTRDTDVFIGLKDRAKFANSKSADLFISIHCNGATRKEANGTEVFVMGLDKSEQNLEIAKKENASILLEDDYEDKYDGMDPNSSEAYIAFSLYQHAFLEQSLSYAAKTMESFNSYVSLTNRGVKQAPFFVLWYTTMPSILIEIGFITNPTEEEFMMQEDNKKKVAYSIYKAFVLYKNEVEGTKTLPVDLKTATGITIEKTVQPNETIINKDTAKTTQINAESIVFGVQLFIDPQLLPQGHERFKGENQVLNYQDGGYYKYYVGQLKSFSEAVELQKKMRRSNFPDAFVIALFEGKRMDLNEARKLTEK